MLINWLFLGGEQGQRRARFVAVAGFCNVNVLPCHISSSQHIGRLNAWLFKHQLYVCAAVRYGEREPLSFVRCNLPL